MNMYQEMGGLMMARGIEIDVTCENFWKRAVLGRCAPTGMCIATGEYASETDDTRYRY